MGTNSLVLTGANTYTGNTTISAGSLQLGNGGAGGTLSGGSNATITDNGTLVFNNNGTLTQGTNFNNSVITGSGGLVQLGPGTTVMNLANSFSGNVTVSGGTLEANYNNGTNGLTAGPLGNMQVSTRSVTVGNGGTLLFPQANGMGGGGSTYLTPIIIQAGGIVSNTSSANVSIGPLTLAGGTLTAVGGTATWNSWDLNGAMTITVTGATNSAITVTGSNASSGMALAPSTTFNVAGPGNLIVSMPLVNQDGGGAAAALVKTGTGLMNVTGPADYSGGTTISGGTLEVSSGTLNNSLAGNISVASSATMEFNPSVAQTYNGVISGAGSVFTKGSFALTLTGANTFTGGLTIGGGTLNLGSFDAGTENTASLGAGSVAITGGGVLALGGTAGSGINYTATNSFTLNNGTIIAEDDLHTFTGTTTIGAGGGTIYTQLRDVVINNLTGSGPLAVNSMFINQTAAAGLVHLSGAGGYTGTVTINQPGVAGAAAGHGGEISVDSATALENAAVVMSGTGGMAFGAPDAVFGSLSGSGAFSLTTAGTLTVGNINTNSTYTGVMSGTGTLLKTGNGLLGLGGVNTYTGGTIVNGGTLQLNIGDAGPLAGGSTVFVNSGATLLGNATDPLNYNGGGYTAVNLVINDGTMFENAPYRATITSLNMTGGTLSSSAGTAANGNNYSLSGTWTVTSDAAGNPALADATDIGLNSGTLNVNRGPGAVDMLISSSIVNYNSSTLIKSGAGILELTGSNSYTGGTTVAAGILELGGTAATLGAPTAIVNMTGGTLDLHGFDPTVAALSAGTGTIADLVSTASTLTIGYGGVSGTSPATIQNGVGTLSLLKVGSGTQILSGSNTYTGTTYATAGVLQFAKTSALYGGNQSNWIPAYITAGSLGTLAVNVDTAGGFTAAQAATLLANLTGNNSGLLAGSSFGIDTTNATAPVQFSTLIQNSSGGSAAVGITKLGSGTLQLTNPSNSYSGPTTVLNGQLMIIGANTSAPAGFVTVSNSTSGGLSILSLLNPNALGSSGGSDKYLAPVSLNAFGGGTLILEIGATLGSDPNYPNFTSDFSYQAVPIGTTPTAGQISFGGNASGIVGFSASSSTFTPRVVALYSSSAASPTLQTLQYGTYFAGNLTLGSSDANTMLILENPIDLNSAAGANWQWSSTRGANSPLPEGEYAGPISNSTSAAINVSFTGNGGLIFANSGSTFNAASMQLVGGALLVGANDWAGLYGQPGALGSGSSALVIGTSPRPPGPTWPS